MFVKHSSIDDKWLGRTEDEGWRLFHAEPIGTPGFVPATKIDESQLSSLPQLYPLLPGKDDHLEWEAIREDSTVMVKGPPAYMKLPEYHWLKAESLNVLLHLHFLIE
jgi:hypothetical protein